jgi:hypothetical protein
VVLLKTSFILHLTPRPATQKDHHEEGGGRMVIKRQAKDRTCLYADVDTGVATF